MLETGRCEVHPSSLRSLSRIRYALAPLLSLLPPCASRRAPTISPSSNSRRSTPRPRPSPIASCRFAPIGGLDQVDDQVLAQGPTTGLILTADGYIVSSAFNFAQQPASILVRLPGGRAAAGRD